MSKNVTIKPAKKQNAKQINGKKTEKTEKSVSSSCVSAKYWAIKPLLLLLRCLSEKNYVVKQELNKSLAMKRFSQAADRQLNITTLMRKNKYKSAID